MSQELAVIEDPEAFHKAPFRIRIVFVNEVALREIMGNLEKRLRVMEKSFSVSLLQSGAQIFILGEKSAIKSCARAIEQFLICIQNGHMFRGNDFAQFCRLLAKDSTVDLLDLHKECIFSGKKKIFPRSPRQKKYVEAIKKNDLVFGVGPAGTGKTYLAMAMALDALHKEEVRKIILCRPAVEAGEKLGFLPGDMLEKVDPYLRPLYDALYDLVGAEKGVRYIERNIIEVAPLAFMRGRTLAHSFIIMDEAQNTTSAQLRMFLTRFGFGSKVVVNGDPSQIDLPSKQICGLTEALRILRPIKGVGLVQLTAADVVRHPLVSKIIDAYAASDRNQNVQ